MKKILALIMALVLSLTFAACSENTDVAEETSDSQESEETEQTAGEQIANPITTYDSLEELNSVSGANFVEPGVMGSTSDYFQSINCGDYTIYEYGFTVNGTEYNMRYSGVYDTDISGVWEDGKTVFDGEDQSVTLKCFEDCKLYRWFTTDGQYVISVFDNNELEEEQFIGICEELSSMIVPNNSGDPLENFPGSYFDETSQRASMEILRIDDENLGATVSWSDGADSTTVWSMTLHMDSDARFYYEDCKCVTVAEEETVIYENGEGYFEFDSDGKLLWTGASDENCCNCVFTKAE